jgi:hypothetical protein
MILTPLLLFIFLAAFGCWGFLVFLNVVVYSKSKISLKKNAANTVVKHDAEICQRIVEDQMNYLIRAGLCFTDQEEKITVRDNLFRIVHSKLQQI